MKVCVREREKKNQTQKTQKPEIQPPKEPNNRQNRGEERVKLTKREISKEDEEKR